MLRISGMGGEMVKRGIRGFLWFFLPGGLLFFIALAFVWIPRLQTLVPGITAIAPYAVLVVGTLLGWRFNRSRMVFGLVVFFLADLFLAGFPKASAGSIGWNVRNIVALLLAVNLSVIFLVRERGLLTPRGLWRLALLAMQPLAVFLVFRHRPDLPERLAAFKPVAISMPDWLPLTQVPLLACGLAALLFLAVSLKRRGVLDYGFSWALAAGFVALLPWKYPENTTLFFAAAGLILVIAALEEAYKMAFRDELTGLPARRALNEDLLKLGAQYTVAMVDIDFFKKFNDKYGHDVGDQVLRMVAGRLALVSGGGRAYRYGGEEFTLLFPGLALEDALPHLERLRLAIQGAGFTLRGQGRPKKKPQSTRPANANHKQVGVTVSIGAAEPHDRQEKHQKVLKAADKALYLAKKRGRNQVVGK